MPGTGTPASNTKSIQPILVEEAMRTRTSQGHPKTHEPKVFKIQKIAGKTPEPSKLVQLHLSGGKSSGSFSSQGILPATNGATKGLSAKDVYQVGAYYLNKTSKTPCSIIARPPSG